MTPLLWRGAVPLGLYVLLKGLNATVLKGLQEMGAQRLVDGENPISFCNVFFLAQMIVGLAVMLPGRRQLGLDLARLMPSDRRLLAVDAFLGLFLGPVAYYFALSSLSVISQTLIFALVLPVSALLAQRLLAEPLPDGFGVSFGLIGLGLLLANLAGGAVGGGGMGAAMDNLAGMSWALLGVLAFSGAAVTGRRIASKGWSGALTVGLASTVSALIFGLLALLLFGPGHFVLLQLWWVVGVIGLYGLTLSLGSELALRRAYAELPVATVSLWGSLTIVVAVLSAALLLGEQISAPTLAGVGLLLLGVSREHWHRRLVSGLRRP